MSIHPSLKTRRAAKAGAALAAALLVFGIGYWSGGGAAPGAPRTAEPADLGEAGPAGAEELVFVCPMSDIPPMPEAGSCPVCGMELVAMPAAAGGDSWRLRLDSSAVRAAGIRVAAVERRAVASEVRLFGRIDFDPAHTTRITAFTPGVIDRVYVKRAGQFVRWGDPLFDIYSSDLLETQRQMSQVLAHVPGFLAFQSGAAHAALDAPVQPRPGPGAEGLTAETKNAYKILEGIRHKLSLLGLPKRDIDELMKRGEATGIATVYASMYGQVVRQEAFEGAFVNVGTPIFTLADPRYVWARMDAYEIDYPWLRQGQAVTFETDAYPGERFEAKVVFVDPVFDPKSRTFAVGAICGDQGGRLKAGMLIRAVIHARMEADGTVARSGGQASSPPLVIPATAPLVTGRRSVVYVRTPGAQGEFEGREVTLGPRSGEHYVVLGGLAEGELVVVNGAFKIDSAVQILARGGMLAAEGGGPAVGHHLPGSSAAMHDDYAAERRESLERGRAGGPGEGAAEALGSRPEPRPGERHTIQRRRPGAYGESSDRPPRRR